MIQMLKEKTTQLRRSHIIVAAITVFAAHGFHRSTIRDVAREAGVADGTIYNYFENKTALLFATLDPMDEVHAVQEAPIAPPKNVRLFLLQSLKQRFAALTPEMIDLHRIILSEVLINPELRDLYVERILGPTFKLPHALFEGFASAGQLRSDDVAFTLRALTASVLGLVVLLLLGDDYTKNNWQKVPDLLSSLMLDGLLADSGDGRIHDVS